MKKLVVRTDADMNGYYWTIETDKVVMCSRSKHPFTSRRKAKAAAQEFINRCLTDRSQWPEEYQ